MHGAGGGGGGELGHETVRVHTIYNWVTQRGLR